MRKTVTIGIPAYQSEQNIKQLLLSILKQRQDKIRIERILVYVDGSKDSTAQVARSVKNKKIQVINSSKNKGFAFGLQTLISKNNSDVFVGLNDDIRIDSNTVIEELVKPFSNKRIGLVGGNITALPPISFIGRCIYSSYLVFKPLRLNVKKGNSDLTCDGKIFALSKAFAKTLNLKRANVGNVDIYLYYENLKQRRGYAFSKKAEVKFRLPETITDFKNQEARAAVSRKIMQNTFGSLFVSNHYFPKMLYLRSILSVFIRYPVETLVFKLFINNFLDSGKKSYIKWKLALTTKKLSIFITEWGGVGSSL